MKEITIEELRRIQISMLRYIDEICTKNNLKYFLLGGTLIGAIRHKGYIPWDDDIDICMPIDDYMKLIKIVNESNDPNYIILNPYEHKDYYYSFAKMVNLNTVLIEDNYNRIKNMGVFLDIFPIYNMPENKKELEKFYKKFIKLEKVFFRNYGYEKYYYTNNIVKKYLKMIIYFPEHIFLKKKIYNKLQETLKLMNKYKDVETNLIGNIAPPCSIEFVMRKEIYSSSVDVDFEGLKVKAPIGYDEHLKKTFGDYMKLPPKEEQIAKHNFKAYFKEDYKR